MKRNRIVYVLICCALIGLGLATRTWREQIPGFIAHYGGDTLWATMIFFGFGIVFPHWTSEQLVMLALPFCWATEISQLYHAPWIDSIRSYPLGGLVLGYTFLWSDMVCYTVGVTLGWLLEKMSHK